MSALMLNLGFVRIQKLLFIDVKSDFLFHQPKKLFMDESDLCIFPNVYLMRM